MGSRRCVSWWRLSIFRVPFNGLARGDYYAYRLFEDSLPMSEKERFVGWRAESRLDALNESEWHCLGLDKVLMYGLFNSNGIRFPETRAIYLAGRCRPLVGAMAITTPEDLRSWLRDPANYPFFPSPPQVALRGSIFCRTLRRPSGSGRFQGRSERKSQ